MQVFGLAMTTQTSKRKISPMAPQVDCSSCGLFLSHVSKTSPNWDTVWEANRQLISQHLLSTSVQKKWSPVSKEVVELYNDDTEMVYMQAIKNDELM